MAISRVQNVSSNAASNVLTACTAGDYIVVFAYNNINSTVPSLPAGFTSLTTLVNSTTAARFGYKIAVGGETSSGTWTNASHCGCLVYRGVTSFGATPTINTGSGTTITYPGITLQNTSGSSWVAGFAAATAATAGMNGTPTGTAPNLGIRSSQTKHNTCDTNAGVTSFSNQTLTYTTTGLWMSVTIELKVVSLFQQSFAATLLSSLGLSDFYSESNANNTTAIWDVAGGSCATGQTFTSQGGIIAQCKFFCKRVGSPTGNLFAYVFATTGSPPRPTGTSLTTSDAVDITTIGTTNALVAFNFSGANQINLTNGTVYAIVVDIESAFSTNSSNNLTVATDTVTLADPGNAVFLAFTGFTWSASTTQDIPYYVTYSAPLAALTRRVLKPLSAVLSFVGNLAQSFIAGGGGHLFTQGLTATLSFVGASVKLSTRFLSASLSFVGAIQKLPQKALTGTLSFVGTLQKKVSKFVTASLLTSAAITKSATRFLAATLSFVGAMTSAAVHHFTQSLTATLSFVGAFTQSKSFLKALTATLSFVGAISVKQIATRAFTATLSASAALSRSTAKALSATLSFAASLVKRITRSLSGTLSFTGVTVKAIRDAGFTATLSFVGNLVGIAAHFFTRAFTATLSFTGSLASSRLVQRVFTATLAFSGTIRRSVGKALSATLAFSTATRKAIQKVFTPTLAFITDFFRGGAITILAGAVTKCFAFIGISGGTSSATRAGGQTTITRISGDTTGPTKTGGDTTVERTK